MTPTLAGRMQTRTLLLLNVGMAWTLLVTPLLPGLDGIPMATRLRGAMVALGVTWIAGLAWELGYHVAQQLRWEKDWPTSWSLLTGLTEGWLVWHLLGFLASVSDLVPAVPLAAFTAHFASTWVIVWLVANGPLRVVSLRWRYRGGRLL